MSIIQKSEFEERIQSIRDSMGDKDIDIFLVYGDEYRKEHLRYLSDFWPIFERGMVAVGKEGKPVLMTGPEGERYAKEASVWEDVRAVREMEISYVPEQIDFTQERYSIRDVVNDLDDLDKVNRVGVCGIDAMPVTTYKAIDKAIGDAELVNSDDVIYDDRLLKSDNEIEALKKAGEICDAGYKAVLDSDIIGLTEREASAIGEKVAREKGAEDIVFTIMASGERRTNTLIGRPTEKVIEEGEIVMYCLAVQYDGYNAHVEWPFVAGGDPTPEQKRLIDALVVAEDIGVKTLEAGVRAGKVVKKVRDYFRENGLGENDLYPPMHGVGLAEAESPYPDEESDYPFEPGMAINFDVSLFGVDGVGSNRIEEGFAIGEDGLITLSSLISDLREDYVKDL